MESAGTGPPPPSPQSPTGAWSQHREGQVGTVFSLYGTVLPIGKKERKKETFVPTKGIRHWRLFLKKGLFKTEPYWKKSALTRSCASRLPAASDFPAVSRMIVTLCRTLQNESWTRVFSA